VQINYIKFAYNIITQNIDYQSKNQLDMKRLFSVLALLLSLSQVNATHIIGGDFYVTHIEDNMFEVELVLFRDCSSFADFDETISITVFEADTDIPIESLSFDMSLISTENITLGNICFTPEICLEEGRYITTIPLPNYSAGYYLTWERCCRNNLIVNLQNPEDLGMVFTVTIPDPAIQNTTPRFADYPTNAFFCVTRTNEIDFSAEDLDGDSLIYSLDTPLIGDSTGSGMATLDGFAGPKPYTTAPWQTGFNLGNIVGGTPPMAINSETGLITCSPDMIGVYVFAVKIEEYRNGLKIGEVRREIQFEAFICPTDDASSINWPTNNQETFVIEPNKPFCVEITASDPNIGDTIFLSANSMVLDTSFTTPAFFMAVDSINDGSVSSQFCWTPTCDELSIIPYEIELTAFSVGCADSVVMVSEKIDVLVELPEDTPTELVFPLNNEIEYVMNGEQHCFDAVLSDVDCYDTLTFYVDSTRYIFNGSPSPGTFSPTPPSLFGAIGEFCWTPVCEDINEDDNFYALDFMVDSRKCNTVNTYTYPFGVRVLPETDGLIQLPNIFTPNDDASNRDFLAHNNLSNLLPPDFCIENFTITIYNRWGAEVFASTDKFFEWNGMHFNTEEPCSPGVYYYIINYDVFGRSETYTGDITLIR